MSRYPKAILIWAVLLSVLANVFFSRWLAAKISTLPLLNRLKLLDPQAPIVIRETREIRVSPEGEVGGALAQIRSRLSEVGELNEDAFEVLSGAVNFTSDGLFIAAASGLPSKLPDLHIRLSDGKIFKASDVFLDKETGLLFISTSAGGVSAAPLLESGKLSLGDRLLIARFAPEGFKYFESWVNFLPDDKDQPFGFQNSGIESPAGAVIGNYKAEILGIWQNGPVVSEKIRKAFENYLAGRGKSG